MPAKNTGKKKVSGCAGIKPVWNRECEFLGKKV
jgi:hypothetical protein